MKISVSHDLLVGDARMSALSVSALRREFGPSDFQEEIPLHGGAVRVRERWSKSSVSLLRDEEAEAICLFVDPATVQVVVAEEALPVFESEFVRRFPNAQRGIGHSYALFVEGWRLALDFVQSKKRRGAGSSVHRLSRVIISSKKEPNQALEPTTLLVTDRAGARSAPSRVVAHL